MCEQKISDENRLLKTGYKDWDDQLGGIRKGKVTLVCDLTYNDISLTMNMINNMCIDKNEKVLLLSANESEADLRLSLMEMYTGYTRRFKRLIMTKKQEREELDCLYTIPEWSIKSGSNIIVFDDICTINEVIRYCESMHESHKASFAVIDSFDALVNEKDGIDVLNRLSEYPIDKEIAVLVNISAVMLYRVMDAEINNQSARFDRVTYCNENDDQLSVYVFQAGEEKAKTGEFDLDITRNGRITDHIEHTDTISQENE